MCNVSNHTIWCNCHNRPSLKEQLAQAHREGWEQGKAEAQRALCEICCYNSADNPVPDECTTCNESDAIAAMEYGGEK